MIINVRGRALRRTAVIAAASVAAGAIALASLPATAADNPSQRCPDPTVQSVAASRGTFATAQVTVAPGNGFNGGFIYYPTDTSQRYGGIAIVPGYTALFANEEAWMGPWLASFGFVVIGIETNSRNDYDVARGTQLLAALDYLTQSSAVRDRVDASRLAVIGHSMGGGGAISAAERRPTLKAAVPLAPFSPSQNMSTDRVPTMVIAGQNDTVVTPSYLDGLYPTLPSTTQSAFVQLSGADHLFPTHTNANVMRLAIPWLKIFVDNDTRYTQFLCPSMKDTSGVSQYRNKCPYVPSGVPTSQPPGTSASPSVPPTSTRPSTAPPSSPAPPTSATPTSATPTTAAPGGACSATYRTTNTWPGGFQGEVTVVATRAISGWTVRWTLSSGQTVTQVWNGMLSASGSTVSVSNASYNGVLPAAASATFGFLANGTPSTPSITCTSP
jgi:hypothetical protein